MLDQLLARGDGLDALRIAIAGGALLLSLVYLAFVNGPVSTVRTVLKTLPIALLAILPLTYLGVVGAYTGGLLILATALALSALGDFFLALKEKYFVPGLASFLTAHVAYLVALLPRVQMPEGAPLVAIVLAVVAAGAFVV